MGRSSFILNLLSSLTLIATGIGVAWFYQAVELPEPQSPTEAQIVGPAQVEYAGQRALFRVSVPGKDPGELIYTWGVDTLDHLSTHVPELIPTVHAGEVECTTPVGHWRLWCAVVDPVAKTGQMLSCEITVPASPEPDPIPPTPPPPGPTPPAPGPTPLPPPAPANRFSDLTTSAQQWLGEVSSPDKATETQSLRSGALSIVQRLQTGDLSKLEGLSLQLGVVKAVQASNVDAIKAHSSNWTVFGNKVSTYAATALQAKLLQTPADWAEMLTAFANGLKV